MRKIGAFLLSLMAVGFLDAQPQPGPKEPNRLAAFDRNNDGFMDSKEIGEAAKEIETLLITGRAEGALAQLREEKDLRRRLFEGLLANVPGRENQIRPLDPNQDGRFDEMEIRQIFPLFNEQNNRQRNIKANTPFEKLVDKNKDGKIDDREVGEAAKTLAQLSAGGLAFQFQKKDGVVFGSQGPAGDRQVMNGLEAFGDTNKDGKLDIGEQQNLRLSVEGPHQVKTDMDKLLDENKNGKVEAFEIGNLLRKRNIPVVSQGASEGPFAVRTTQDAVFDLNGDKKVTVEELRASAKILLQGPGKDSYPKSLLVFDLNKDGKIIQDEVFRTMDAGFRPHPARNDKSKVFDTNRDGFISPEEVGIAAGSSDKGQTQPFDLYLDMARNGEPGPAVPETTVVKPAAENTTINTTVTISSTKTSSLSTQSLAKYTDKKFGVQVETTSTAISKDTLKGITSFVENAFVNTGKVKLVDRNNLDKIMAEAEFQKSGLSEETQEVKLGKLSGAELMVTGTITIFGKKYYLNLKITSVGNGEILGSAVSEAAGEEDFLDMVNSAVVSLF